MIIEQQIRTTTAVMILQLQLFHNQQSKQGLQPEYKYVPLFQNRQKILLIYQHSHSYTQGFTTHMKMGRKSAWSYLVLSAVSAAAANACAATCAQGSADAWLLPATLTSSSNSSWLLSHASVISKLWELPLVSNEWISQGCQVSGSSNGWSGQWVFVFKWKPVL